jgi:hypothetical protein
MWGEGWGCHQRNVLLVDRLASASVICNYLSQVFLSGFAKLHMGLVVLAKNMSVLINFLLQNTNFVSVLIKICPNFAGHIWQDWQFCELCWF